MNAVLYLGMLLAAICGGDVLLVWITPSNPDGTISPHHPRGHD